MATSGVHAMPVADGGSEQPRFCSFVLLVWLVFLWRGEEVSPKPGIYDSTITSPPQFQLSTLRCQTEIANVTGPGPNS